MERVNHGVNDSTLIEKEKIREFKYRLIPKYLAKLALQTFDSFIEVVQAALDLEQQTVIKKDAEARAKLREIKIRSDYSKSEPSAQPTLEPKAESNVTTVCYSMQYGKKR